jgi:molybdopterin biosynthesis enzyme
MIETVTSSGCPRVILQRPASWFVRVITGAALPEGTDCVIPAEALTLAERFATV